MGAKRRLPARSPLAGVEAALVPFSAFWLEGWASPVVVEDGQAMVASPLLFAAFGNYIRGGQPGTRRTVGTKRIPDFSDGLNEVEPAAQVYFTHLTEVVVTAAQNQAEDLVKYAQTPADRRQAKQSAQLAHALGQLFQALQIATLTATESK